MAALSENESARARKNASIFLQRLASVGQATVAEKLSTSESTVSRMKGKDLEEFSQVLALLGLKLVPDDMRCYKPEAIQAIFTLARMAMANTDPESLVWEE